MLAKIGGCVDFVLLPFVRAQRIFAYRNQVTFHMKEGQTCFYRQATHDYVAVNRCELLEEPLNRAVDEINAMRLTEATSVFLRGDNTGHVFAAVNNGSAEKAKELLSFSDVITGAAAVNEKGTAVYGDDTLLFDLDGIKLKTSYKSFFQVNTEMAKSMLLFVKELMGDEKQGVLLDLYCGVGSIGLYLADHFQKVYGIEIMKDAAALAAENAEANEIEAEYISGKTENRLKNLLEKVPRADVVLLDPPRQGLQKDVAKTVAAYGAEKILYISCDPASLSRDLKELTKSYRVLSAKPFDLFPRTAHVETVCLLSKLNTEHHIEVDLKLDELDLTSSESKATYEEIKDYILKTTGLKVSSLYISQVKRKLGLVVGVCYNLPKSDNARVPECPAEKETAITTALKHFEMI
jgi:23S rRNA (uracil1939-C5)-methyltransferase